MFLAKSYSKLVEHSRTRNDFGCFGPVWTEFPPWLKAMLPNGLFSVQRSDFCHLRIQCGQLASKVQTESLLRTGVGLFDLGFGRCQNRVRVDNINHEMERVGGLIVGISAARPS